MTTTSSSSENNMMVVIKHEQYDPKEELIYQSPTSSGQKLPSKINTLIHHNHTHTHNRNLYLDFADILHEVEEKRIKKTPQHMRSYQYWSEIFKFLDLKSIILFLSTNRLYYSRLHNRELIQDITEKFTPIDFYYYQLPVTSLTYTKPDSIAHATIVAILQLFEKYIGPKTPYEIITKIANARTIFDLIHTLRLIILTKPAINPMTDYNFCQYIFTIQQLKPKFDKYLDNLPQIMIETPRFLSYLNKKQRKTEKDEMRQKMKLSRNLYAVIMLHILKTRHSLEYFYDSLTIADLYFVLLSHPTYYNLNTLHELEAIYFTQLYMGIKQQVQTCDPKTQIAHIENYHNKYFYFLRNYDTIMKNHIILVGWLRHYEKYHLNVGENEMIISMAKFSVNQLYDKLCYLIPEHLRNWNNVKIMKIMIATHIDSDIMSYNPIAVTFGIIITAVRLTEFDWLSVNKNVVFELIGRTLHYFQNYYRFDNHIKNSKYNSIRNDLRIEIINEISYKINYRYVEYAIKKSLGEFEEGQYIPTINNEDLKRQFSNHREMIELRSFKLHECAECYNRMQKSVGKMLTPSMAKNLVDEDDIDLTSPQLIIQKDLGETAIFLRKK